MWKILKAEFEYHKLSTTIITGLLLVLELLIISIGWRDADREVPGISTILVATFAFLFLTRTVRQRKERSERFLSLLPVKAYLTGCARSFYYILIWAVMLIIFILQLFILRWHDIRPPHIYYLLSLPGFIAIAISVPYLYRDFTLYISEKIQLIILSVFFAMIVLTSVLFFASTTFHRYMPLFSIDTFRHQKQALFQFASTPFGALMITIIGFLLIYINVIAYCNRKYYCD